MLSEEVYEVYDSKMGQPISSFTVVDPTTLFEGIPILFGADDQPPQMLYRGNPIVSREKFQERFHECTSGIFAGWSAKDWANVVVSYVFWSSFIVFSSQFYYLFKQSPYM